MLGNFDAGITHILLQILSMNIIDDIFRTPSFPPRECGIVWESEWNWQQYSSLSTVDIVEFSSCIPHQHPTIDIINFVSQLKIRNSLNSINPFTTAIIVSAIDRRTLFLFARFHIHTQFNTKNLSGEWEWQFRIVFVALYAGINRWQWQWRLRRLSVRNFPKLIFSLSSFL